jgi:NAD-dependent deacetylase
VDGLVKIAEPSLQCLVEKEVEGMTPGPSPTALAAAREAVAAARRIVALTGAGVSAESGLATFRGAGGHWRNHRAEDLATPAAFGRDPELVWTWYDERRRQAAAAHPNPAHRALAALERDERGAGTSFTLVTQNVDGLHARAGSAAPLELHGSLWTVRCVGCDASRRDTTVPLVPLPPRCAGCGAIERPGIVWFGEQLPADVFGEAARAVAEADLLLVAGTSAVIHPAAGLIQRAITRRIVTIEVNPEPTSFSAAMTHALAGAAGAILPAICGQPPGVSDGRVA